MNEEEKPLKTLLQELTEELQGFKYSLYSWKEELDNYRKAIMESSSTFIKLNITKDKQLEDERKVLEDHWLKQITTINLLGSEIGKLYSLVENKIVSTINDLSTMFNKMNDGNVKTMETLNKLAEGQPKTIVLLQDIKSLLSEQLEIHRKEQLERKKIEKKIEKEIGE